MNQPLRSENELRLPPEDIADDVVASSGIADQLSNSRASLALSEASWLLARLARRFALIPWTRAGLADLDEHLDELDARLAHLRSLVATRRVAL